MKLLILFLFVALASIASTFASPILGRRLIVRRPLLKPILRPVIVKPIKVIRPIGLLKPRPLLRPLLPIL